MSEDRDGPSAPGTTPPKDRGELTDADLEGVVGGKKRDTLAPAPTAAPVSVFQNGNENTISGGDGNDLIGPQGTSTKIG